MCFLVSLFSVFLWSRLLTSAESESLVKTEFSGIRPLFRVADEVRPTIASRKNETRHRSANQEFASLANESYKSVYDYQYQPSASDPRDSLTYFEDSRVQHNNNDVIRRNGVHQHQPSASNPRDSLNYFKDSHVQHQNSDSIRVNGAYLLEDIDPHDYAYIHNPLETCYYSNGTFRALYLIILVPSAPWHQEERDVIRRTFWRENQWPIINGSSTRTVFLLGATHDPDVQGSIDTEAAIFNDVVQENFQDSYANLTRKIIMGFKWFRNYCSHANYFMKLDDDSTINQAKILRILAHAPGETFVTGHVLENAEVDRNIGSKFYLSEEYYPGQYFPSYVQGACYILSADVVELVYRTAVSLPVFPWEDVFVGMCLQALGITPIHREKFVNLKPISNPFVLLRPSNRLRKYAVFSDLSMKNMLQIWDLCRVPANTSLVDPSESQSSAFSSEGGSDSNHIDSLSEQSYSSYQSFYSSLSSESLSTV